MHRALDVTFQHTVNKGRFGTTAVAHRGLRHAVPVVGLGSVYAAGDCEIDLVRRELRVSGEPGPIGARAFEILGLLVEAASELVTKNALMDRVWPGATVSDNALQVHISSVRKALGSHRSMLKTESGLGYRLLGGWTARQEHDSTYQLAVVPITPAQ